jgi:hypothetical protein
MALLILDSSEVIRLPSVQKLFKISRTKISNEDYIRLEQKYFDYFPLEVISTNHFCTERSGTILSRRQAKLDSNYQYHYQPVQTWGMFDVHLRCLKVRSIFKKSV